MPRWLSEHRRMQCRQTLTVRVWRHRSNAICRQNCRQMDVRPLVAGRKNFELAGEMGGAKGIRTPDPHTARVKATVLVRSAVSTEWPSVQLDEQFSC